MVTPYYNTDEGAKPLDELRDYDFVFYIGGKEVIRTICNCPAKEVPRKLRELREEETSGRAVTAVPNLTFSEEFIKEHGFGVF